MAVVGSATQVYSSRTLALGGFVSRVGMNASRMRRGLDVRRWREGSWREVTWDREYDDEGRALGEDGSRP